MAAIGITEHAKGDSKKFEIWSSSRDEVYTVQVSTRVCVLVHIPIKKIMSSDMC